MAEDSVAARVKTCTTCQNTFPADEAFFWRDDSLPDGLKKSCRLCSAPSWRGKYITADLLWARYYAKPGDRVCTSCLVAKPENATNFFRHKMSRGGLTAECKTCHRGRPKKSPPREPNTDPSIMKRCRACIREFPATTEWFHAQKYGKHGVTGQCKECYRARKDHEAEKIRSHAWYWADPAAVNKKRRDRERKNMEAHRAMKRAHACRRRARKLASGGDHTRDDVAKQLKSQKHRCWWCNIKLGVQYEVDHLFPLSKGGSNGPENIVASCPDCNRSKGAKMPWQIKPGRLL